MKTYQEGSEHPVYTQEFTVCTNGTVQSSPPPHFYETYHNDFFWIVIAAMVVFVMLRFTRYASESDLRSHEIDKYKAETERIEVQMNESANGDENG